MLFILSFYVGCNEEIKGDTPVQPEEIIEEVQPSDESPIDTSVDTNNDSDTQADTDDTDPCAEAPPTCEGICALIDPICTLDGWICTAPRKEEVEISCDGFDNDCDGQVDEDGICPECVYDTGALQAALGSAWDIDFDYDCNTYLTSFVSGSDWTVVVPEDPQLSSTRYYGNANQNMGWALVDPDPSNRRVVVTYSCCSGCGCQAQNGLTLLYTCEPTDPNCGCIGESNCPGFLDEPFIPSTVEDIPVTINGSNHLSSPNGLAVGPDLQNAGGDFKNSYYVGNFKASQCSDATGCHPCGPNEPGNWCATNGDNCCEEAAVGRLVRFRLPDENGIATWRTEHVFEGETIFGLSSGRDGSLMIGTLEGNLYVWDPISRQSTLLQSFGGAVLSITQERPTGDWYVETQADPKIVRLNESGVLLSLPTTVPANPEENGVLQWGSDGQLWRLRGKADATSTLESYALP